MNNIPQYKDQLNIAYIEKIKHQHALNLCIPVTRNCHNLTMQSNICIHYTVHEFKLISMLHERPSTKQKPI